MREKPETTAGNAAEYFPNRPHGGLKVVGFTLIELLVVVAIIAILAGMLFPALAKGKQAAQKTKCVSNLSQLQLCWQLYADDHDEFLPPNEYITTLPGLLDTNSWIIGNPQKEVTDDYVRNGVLFAYNKSTSLYHCPSDRSTVKGKVRILRVVSYSMDLYLGGRQKVPPPYDRVKFITDKYDPRRAKKKSSQLSAPASIFVFGDESSKTIVDGVFIVVPSDRIAATGEIWGSVPADRHSQSGAFSFADGHTEAWKWQWPKAHEAWNPATTIADKRDLARLQAALPD